MRKVLNLPKYYKKDNVWQEKKITYSSKFLKKKNSMYIRGYFQSPRYFDNIRNKLLEEFTPKKPLSKENLQVLDKIQKCNSCSIHIRRGDYIDLQKIHGLLSIDYYRQATNFIKKKTKEPVFFVFSNDIDWCKSNLKIPAQTIYVNHNSREEVFFDIWLMKHCKNNIIANSSFS